MILLLRDRWSFILVRLCLGWLTFLRLADIAMASLSTPLVSRPPSPPGVATSSRPSRRAGGLPRAVRGARPSSSRRRSYHASRGDACGVRAASGVGAGRSRAGAPRAAPLASVARALPVPPPAERAASTHLPHGTARATRGAAATRGASTAPRVGPACAGSGARGPRAPSPRGHGAVGRVRRPRGRRRGPRDPIPGRITASGRDTTLTERRRGGEESGRTDDAKAAASPESGRQGVGTMQVRVGGLMERWKGEGGGPMPTAFYWMGSFGGAGNLGGFGQKRHG